MSNWATLSENSGVGDTIITVNVPASATDRRCKYRVSTPFQYADVTIIQGNASPYFTVWYDVPYPYELKIMNSGKYIKKMKVDDGVWINSAYDTGTSMYVADSTYTFNSIGIHKIDYVTEDESTIPNHFLTDCLYAYAVNIPGEYNIVATGLQPADTQLIFSYSRFKKITINDGVRNITGFAFRGSSVNSIIIPDSVMSVGDYAFADSLSLEEIKFSDSMTYIGLGICSNCYNLKNVILPSGCTSIGVYGGGYAFSNCISLREIVLPSTLSSLHMTSFSGCYNLETIYSYAETSPSLYFLDDINGFADLKPYGTLHYPQGSDYSEWLQYLPETWTGIDDL